MLRNAAQRPNNNANPTGAIRKKHLLRRKAAILSVRRKFYCIAKSIVALFLKDLAIQSLFDAVCGLKLGPIP